MALQSRGNRYTTEQKDAVFSVWAFEADRLYERAARMVGENDSCRELGILAVSGPTVKEWAIAYDWPARADRMLHANAPRARFETQVSLILAAPEAGRFLRDLVRLDESLKVDRVIVTDDGPITVKVFDDKILKTRLTAALGTLDRTGFSPIGTRDKLGSIDDPPTTETAKALVDTMDTEELKQHEQYIRQKIGIGRGS